MNILKVVLPLFLLGLFACTGDESNIPTPTTENPATPITTPTAPMPTGEELYLNEKSDVIFDQSQLHTFELTLSPSDLQKINADPAAEEYVEGKLTFNGETIEPVGIRYKGSIGAFVGCLTGRDWANPSGSKTCTKLSMKVKINWNDPEARFYGLKKLQFHSQNNDDSQMRDRLGYYFFREMGVPAPRAVHARLVINGEYSGVYALIEQIDGRFTRQNFDDGTGNLYKEIWPLQSNGQPFPEKEYLDHLKTNEDENPTADLIRDFAIAVANAGEEELQAVIAEWMNIEEIMSYIAVDRTIRNDDGAFHWYCNGGDCSPHNFYWYEDPTEKRLHLIPWDLDNAFENIISPANPVTPIVDPWGKISNNCEPFASGFLGLRQRSSACDKLTGGWASFTEEYEAKREAFKEGPLSEVVVDALIANWQEQIRAATQEAEMMHTDAVTVDRWENAISIFKTQLRTARVR